MFSRLWNWSKSKRAMRSVPKPRPPTVLRLEGLEERAVPALVMNLNDSGNGSLRAAIVAANLAGGDQQISFAGLNGTISLQSALPDFTANIALSGQGSSVTVGRDSHAATTFRIFSVDASSTSSIGYLTITGGVADGIGATDGGGILNQGSLTIGHDTIDRNQATNNGSGGGIKNAQSANLYVEFCTIGNNSADARGGGIFNEGWIDVYNNTGISLNTANIGAGIDNAPAATATLSGSTSIGDNTAVQEGGGVANFGSFSMSGGSIYGNQVTGNAVGQAGGGFYNGGSNTTATLTGVGINNNSAGAGKGGGFYVANGSSLTLNSCSVSGNIAATGNGGYVQNGATYTAIYPNYGDGQQVIGGP